MIGTTVGGYRIEAELGRGGMGVVYWAVDEKLDRHVALKFLREDLAKKEGSRARFLREARAAAALDHPNIGTVYQIGETDEGQIFICMAFYDGETLGERIEREPFAFHEALETAAAIARGLGRAHASGVVHRDIKPGNILITEHGEVKIVDFGLAKLEEDSRLTQTGSTLGTLAYMSPEQASGEETDHRTDLWSLGVVLYEMLMGHKPFRGNSMASVVNAVVRKEPEPVTGIPDQFHGRVERLLSGLLAKDPEDRYETAEQVLGDLTPLLGHLSSEKGRDTTWLAPRAPKKKGRIPQWLQVGVVLALVGGGGFWISRIGSGGGSKVERAASRGAADASLLVAQARDLFEATGSNQRSLSMELFREALELDPDSFEARLGLAEAVASGAKNESDAALYREAEKIVTIAIQHRPDSLEAGIVLARVLMGTDRLDAAIRTLRRLTARNPLDPDAHETFAEALARSGELAEAEGHFRQAIVLDPDNWARRNALGSFYLKIGQTEEASIAFEEAADLAPPGETWPLENLASVAMVSGDWGAAVDYYSEFPRPITEPAVASNIGTAYFYLGDLDEAERHYRLAIRLFPKGQTYHRNLGDCLQLAGDHEGAMAAYRDASLLSMEELQSDPNNISLGLGTALLFAKSGDCKQALESGSSLAERISGSASEYYRLAEIFALCGDRSSSLTALRKSIANGYPLEGIRIAEELRSLRGDREFEELMNGEG